MSNAISYDPLLVRYLAEELDGRLQGRPCASVPVFGGDRSAVLPLGHGEALALELHPLRGTIRIVPWQADLEELDAVCDGVHAPPDERRLVLRLRADDRFRALHRRLEVELHTNQWNALLVDDEDDRILSVLWSRTAGGRVLRTGVAYRPPAGGARFGAEAVEEDEAWRRWMERLAPVPPAERGRTLVAEFAYTGAASREAILGEAGRVEGEAPLLDAWARWWEIRSLPPARPVLLRRPGGWLPYPLPLPGVDHRPAASLLDAMAEVAAAVAAATSPAEALPGVPFVRRRLEAAERRVRSLEAEEGRAGEAARMRLWGDLLLARKRLVPRGAESVRLQDWSGGLVQVQLDPTLTAAENAAHWYDEARKRERADERLPELLASARAERDRWRDALERVERGEVLGWLAGEIERTEPVQESGEPEEARPYRRYRTTGGLEVRVGRSSRANDQLTFAHSTPNDVWLHARSVPGSHVILRWRDPEGAPPARDLEEAAGLAALHSKARSSSLVPVDWTRRKYVRKPRGAPPGAVIPQRVKTLFVEPDEKLEERMRDG